MNCNDDIYRKAFEDGLQEHQFYYQLDTNNIYSITSNIKPDRITTAKLICSKPINEKIHGSKNNTEIKANGYFLFDLSPGAMQPDFYTFAFFNAIDRKVEFVIVPTDEMKNRLSTRKCITDKNQKTELKFWLLPDNLLFETTNFGAEGEWWFVGGRMAENTIWDYTIFLNCWENLKDIMR